MKSLQRLTAVVALVGLLAVGVPLGAANSVAYTSGSATTATVVYSASFCPALAGYIAKLETLRPGPVRDFLLAVARRVYDRHCRG